LAAGVLVLTASRQLLFLVCADDDIQPG